MERQSSELSYEYIENALLKQEIGNTAGGARIPVIYTPLCIRRQRNKTLEKLCVQIKGGRAALRRDDRLPDIGTWVNNTKR
jgi:hypothetical protein